MVKNSTIIDSVISRDGTASQLIELLSNHLQNVTINTDYHNGMRMADCRGGNVSIHVTAAYSYTSYFEINDTTLTNVFVNHKK
jgi:hypothetical protein